MRTRPILAASVVLLVSACHRSAEDRQVAAIHDAAHKRAALVQEQATGQAAALDAEAHRLNVQAKAAGGYTGERLAVQADADSRQADILKKQGRDQADAVKLAAESQVKAIRSR